MKNKINALIVECLGVLPDEIKTFGDIDIVSKIYDIWLGGKFNTARILLKQEQQKRELLAGLIETTLELEYMIKKYGKNEIIIGKHCYWDNLLYHNNAMTIEKTLNRKWNEIIKYLEGGEW